jgi:hypothetical protein
MKKCEYCGKEYPDEATVCDLDAYPLVASKEATARMLPSNEMNWLDKQFANSGGILGYGGIFRWAMSIIGVMACKHPIARKNAWINFGWQIVFLGVALIILLTMKKTAGGR